MPTLTIAHAQYFRNSSGGAPAPVSKQRGYPAWQAAVTGAFILLFWLVS